MRAGGWPGRRFEAEWVARSKGMARAPRPVKGGYQEDGDSGLKLLGHWFVNLSTGRFLTRDLAKDGSN